MDSVKHPALLMVDSVSALASIDFRMDEWGVDVCVSGSQKGLMLPAGLGRHLRQPKGARDRQAAASRRCYFDFGDMVRCQCLRLFPYTPSLQMMCALRESLAMLAEEGLENVFRRHRYLAGGARAAVLEGWKMQAVRGGAQVVFGYGDGGDGPRGHRLQPPSSPAPTRATICRSAPACPRSPESCSASAMWGISMNSCCWARSPAQKWRCWTSG